MKKKICLISIIGLALLSGCSKGYKEGVYTGTAIDSYGGQNNTATAIVTVDKNGKITDVNLDTTYTKDGVETTKKTLGDAYGMYGNEYGSKVGEWYTQGLDKVKLTDDGYTDTVSGCTIKIDALYEALENALNQAKK